MTATRHVHIVAASTRGGFMGRSRQQTVATFGSPLLCWIRALPASRKAARQPKGGG
jgi:hypothetical protein